MTQLSKEKARRAKQSMSARMAKKEERIIFGQISDDDIVEDAMDSLSKKTMTQDKHLDDNHTWKIERSKKIQFTLLLSKYVSLLFRSQLS